VQGVILLIIVNALHALMDYMLISLEAAQLVQLDANHALVNYWVQSPASAAYKDIFQTALLFSHPRSHPSALNVNHLATLVLIPK